MGHDLPVCDFSTSLESILREGARKLLQQAIENEVSEYLEPTFITTTRSSIIFDREGQGNVK